MVACGATMSTDFPIYLSVISRKRVSEKPIVAFTNSTVFILDLGLSLFGLMFWPAVLSQTIPDCVRYIIGVFCYNFKSQTNILAS